MWNAGSREEISRLSLPGNARGGVFSPDAGTLTTISARRRSYDLKAADPATGVMTGGSPQSVSIVTLRLV